MTDIVRTEQGAEFLGLPDTRSLGEALILSGPYKVDKAPNAYSFSRPNDVEIDWRTILAKVGIPAPPTNAGQLRTYVEDAWATNGAAPDDALINLNAFDLEGAWPAFVPDAGTSRNAVETRRDHPTFFKGNLLAYKLPPETEKEIAINRGCVFKVQTKDGVRWYQPLIVADTGTSYPAIADFKGGAWQAKWDQVTALAQLFYPGARPADQAEQDAALVDAKLHARTHYPAVENVRADAATISRQYQLLKNEDELAQSLSVKASEISQAIQVSQIEVIPALVEQFRNLKNFGAELLAKKRQLADAASDLNFHLFTTDKAITVYQDGTGAPSSLEIKEGDLYVKSNRTSTWITYQSVTRSNSGIFGIGASSRTYRVPIRNSVTFDYYEKAIVDYDPWVDILELYKSKGYDTYLFRYTENGLRAADGASAADILEQCHDNEAFRLRCVVALPEKEITLIGETFITGYNIFVRPVPDIVVTSFPELSLRERLSYRFTWRGVSLGELATTIPLSPGEQREVTLKTSERYNSSRSETASSLVDITRIDRADFETVFEKEVRKENETATSSSAGLSGSYAGISGSANFSKTTSTKEVARQLNRSVQRASQEVNRRSKDERTVTISEAIETTRENTTSFRVRNINEGSTLNIAFYRLYNAFESILRLDEFDYVVRAGRALFAGSDLVDEHVFPRDGILALIKWLTDRDRFPFVLSELTDVQIKAFAAELHAQVIEKYKEYPPRPPETQEGGDAQALLSVAIRAGDGEPDLSAEAAPATVSQTMLEARDARIDAVQAQYRAIGEGLVAHSLNSSATTDQLKALAPLKTELEDEIIGLPFWDERTSFAYDSGGLYVDVYVGQRPATEKYSENMRRLEEGRVERENRLLDARALNLEARAAKQIIGLGGLVDPAKIWVTDRDTLILDSGHVELKLRLVPGLLWNRGWTVIIASAGTFNGGRFLQADMRVEGVLMFNLPRRFSNGDDNIIDKSHAWFKQNVTIRNEDLGFTVKYKEP